MIFETLDGIKLSYEIYGEGNPIPLLLLHGLGADHQMWLPQLSRYPAEDLFVVAPDVRGHGNSSAPQAFAIEDCARDASELLSTLGIARASVAGVSMGGLIAQQLACDYPEQVDKLVIVDSFSGLSTLAERFNGCLASFLLAVSPTSLQSRLLVTTYTRMGKPDVAAYFETKLNRVPPGRLRQMRKVVNGFDIVDRLGEVQVPTLVLVGDGFGTMAIGMARRTADAIPGASFAVLEGGGDPSNLLVPDAFDQEVLRFVRQDIT